MTTQTTMTTAIVSTTTNCRILEKKPLKLRHEIKYNINYGESKILSSRLKNLFKYDKNADSHGTYRVSSLYFDTPYDKALKEKLDGVKNREKFRIRYYNEQTDFISLEKKIKTGGLCGKHRTVITKKQVEDILKGDYSMLADTEDPLLFEFYTKLKGQLLRPKTIVTYVREAFLYEPGNVRITMDRELSTHPNPMVFLNLPKELVNMSQGLTVLEVKYDAYLPDLVKLAVGDVGRSSTAFSKYAVSRRYD